MAKGGERRLLFDTRGRRKHVIRVVYAILAILMGASLFLVVGPVNIGSLLGTQSSSSSAAQVFDEQAERIERRLAKDPTDEALLLALARARINGGNAQIEVNEGTETATVPASAREDFEAALGAWNRYLKQAGDEPNAVAAQLVASSFFRLAESSTSLREAVADISKATEAQKIAAEQRPNLGSLSTLAIYQYFNGEFAAGDKTTKQAAAKAPSKAETKTVENQLAEFRKRGKQLEKQKKQLAKVEKETSKEQLTNPFGGFGGAPSSGGG
jgi:tetratricopeptide (TPR) repeat protein